MYKDISMFWGMLGVFFQCFGGCYGCSFDEM